MGTTCQVCEKAKWKAKEGVESCNLCASTLEDSITAATGSKSVGDCICPSGTFDNEKGSCVVVEDGMDDLKEGMSLADVMIEPGWWRTGKNSTDVRECPLAEACIGGGVIQLIIVLKATLGHIATCALTVGRRTRF